MACLTLILFDIYIFWGFNFVTFYIIFFAFTFLAPEITTTDGMSNVTIFYICIFWCFKFVSYFDITYFPFMFLAPEITTTDGMSNVNIISYFFIF